MTDRRNFLKNAGAFALGALLFPACNPASKEGAATETTGTDTTATNTGAAAATGNLGAIGLQLYSVKDVIEKDLKGTLKQLGEIGYTEIESYPGEKGHYFGMEPKEFAKMAKDLGLTLVSSHFGSGTAADKPADWRQANMLHRFEELCGKAAQTGQKYITCSSLNDSLRKTKEDLKRTAALFNQSGETAKKAGLQFAYHNHDFEFKSVGDVMLYDFLLANTDPELVKYELDLFWVAAAGKDPVAYLEKHPNRFPLCHVKDMDKQDKTKNTEVGSGSIDYQKVLKAAKDNGMKHYLVEQETFTRPSIESMRISYNHLAKMSV